ncbi:Os01g0303300, partial [Oryza sativa Japonica Group]
KKKSFVFHQVEQTNLYDTVCFSFLAGLAAGVYSGLTYGLREARGCHDWKNSAVAGAIAGVAVALTGDTGNADHMVHFAITGAALSSAASLLSGIY